MKEYYKEERKRPESKGLLLCVLVFSIFALVVMSFSVGVWMMQDYNGRQQVDNTSPKLIIINNTAIVSQNNSEVIKAIQNLSNDLNSEDIFITNCKELSIEEYSNHNFRDIYEWMSSATGGNLSISDREDISSIRVDDDDVTSIDETDGNCDVSQDVVVRYEDTIGNKRKAYITIDTEISDNEIDNQEFSY